MLPRPSKGPFQMSYQACTAVNMFTEFSEWTDILLTNPDILWR